MKLNFFKSIALLGLTGLIVISCQSDDSDSLTINTVNEKKPLNESDPSVKKILSMGFNLNNIEELKDYYLVENDILFSKHDTNLQNTGKPAQAHSNSLVSMDNVNIINVGIHNSLPSSGDDNWRNAIVAAINDWNSISDCRVNFTITATSEADILIGSDEGILPPNTPASAILPISGQPGFQIAINLDAANNRVFSEDEKKHILKHELGHTIGFCHTNGPLRGEDTDPSGYNVIQYTPTGFGSNQDPSSVMNTGTVPSLVFSSYDLFAARYLYPELYLMSEMISYPLDGTTLYGSGGFNISWRPSFILEQNIKIEVFLENVLVKTITEKNDGNSYIGNYGDGQYKIKISSPSNPNSFDIQSFYYVND